MLCLGEAGGRSFQAGTLRKRDGGSAKGRWMEARSRRKQGSSSICATVCDRPVLLLLSLGDPCRGARRGSAASPSQFITGLDQAVFVCSFHSGAAESQGNKKKERRRKQHKGQCTASSAQRGGGGVRGGGDGLQQSEQVTSEISGFLLPLSLEGSQCGASLGGPAGGRRVKVSQRRSDQKIAECQTLGGKWIWCERKGGGRVCCEVALQ